jgi:hypothetical protein
MHALITREQFDALAELGKLQVGSNCYLGARLVMVDGKTIGAASRELAMDRADLSYALKRIRTNLETAKKAAGYVPKY